MERFSQFVILLAIISISVECNRNPFSFLFGEDEDIKNKTRQSPPSPLGNSGVLSIDSVMRDAAITAGVMTAAQSKLEAEKEHKSSSSSLGSGSLGLGGRSRSAGSLHASHPQAEPSHPSSKSSSSSHSPASHIDSHPSDTHPPSHPPVSHKDSADSHSSHSPSTSKGDHHSSGGHSPSSGSHIKSSGSKSKSSSSKSSKSKGSSHHPSISHHSHSPSGDHHPSSSGHHSSSSSSHHSSSYSGHHSSSSHHSSRKGRSVFSPTSAFDLFNLGGLATPLECDLVSTLSLILCGSLLSASSQGESYESAVLSPTKVALSQLKEELETGSITNAVALQRLMESVGLLQNLIDDKELSLFSNPEVQRQLVSISNALEDLRFLDAFDESLVNERKAVLELLDTQQQLSVPKKGDEAVLERPLVLDNEEGQEAPEEASEPQDTQERVVRETNLPGAQSCTLPLASSLCPHADTKATVDAIMTTMNIALQNILESRQLILTDMMKSSSCTSPEVPRNLMAYSSLGTISLPLVNVLRALTEFSKSDLSRLTSSTSSQSKDEAIADQSEQNLNPNVEQISDLFPSDFIGNLNSNMNPLLDNMFSSVVGNNQPLLNEVPQMIQAPIQQNPIAGIMQGGGNPLNGMLSGGSNFASSALKQFSKTTGNMMASSPQQQLQNNAKNKFKNVFGLFG